MSIPMITKHSTNCLPNFCRWQFLNLNTRSVRYTTNILRNQIEQIVRCRAITMLQNDGVISRFALMNKLIKVKLYLKSQRSDGICRPITDIKSFVEIWDVIQRLVTMVEMAYGLPNKHEDHTTAIILVLAPSLRGLMLGSLRGAWHIKVLMHNWKRSICRPPLPRSRIGCWAPFGGSGALKCWCTIEKDQFAGPLC